MSKRVRTSRIANAKKIRRSRPSGEREVTGRESLSSLDFEDGVSIAPASETDGPVSEAPESARASATDTEPPAPVEVAAAPAVSKSVPDPVAEAIVPAVVTGETPPPPLAEEVVPGDPTPAPPAVTEAVTEALAEPKAEPEGQVAAPDASVPTEVRVDGALKKKKKKGAVGGTRPEDANASSGALSLNEPLARGFYESAPPHDPVDEDEVEAAQPVALSPEVLERKARLRRIVMGVFAAASLVVMLVAGKTLLAKNAPHAPAPDVSHALEAAPSPKEEAPKPAEPAKAEAPKPAPAPAPAPEASAKAEETKAEEKKEEPKAEDKPKGDPAELKKTASKLYNSGKLKDAIPALREAIAADPDDALPYLFLGDALTNTGKWPEAKDAYNDCVTNAKKGPKHECAAMGGTKKK